MESDVTSPVSTCASDNFDDVNSIRVIERQHQETSNIGIKLQIKSII